MKESDDCTCDREVEVMVICIDDDVEVTVICIGDEVEVMVICIGDEVKVMVSDTYVLDLCHAYLPENEHKTLGHEHENGLLSHPLLVVHQ